MSLKKSFGKVVFQILANIKMLQNENRLFGRHFETVLKFHIKGKWFFKFWPKSKCREMKIGYLAAIFTYIL